MAYEADAIIGGKIPTEAWPKTPKLKLFQIPWTGYDLFSRFDATGYPGI